MNGNRRFLRRVLESGLELGVLTADDIVAQVDADVLAHHLPVGLKAKLLGAALAAKEMTAKLVVDTLGIEALAENAPTPSLWSAAAEAMQRSMGDEPATEAPAPTASAGAKPAAPPATPAPDEEDDTREGAAKASAVGSAAAGPLGNGATGNGVGRKPNRMARPSLRGRAGATSRRRGGPNDDDFEVDTKVGDGVDAPADFEIIDEADVFEEGSTAVRGEATTSPGLRKR